MLDGHWRQLKELLTQVRAVEVEHPRYALPHRPELTSDEDLVDLYDKYIAGQTVDVMVDISQLDRVGYDECSRRLEAALERFRVYQVHMVCASTSHFETAMQLMTKAGREQCAIVIDFTKVDPTDPGQYMPMFERCQLRDDGEAIEKLLALALIQKKQPAGSVTLSTRHSGQSTKAQTTGSLCAILRSSRSFPFGVLVARLDDESWLIISLFSAFSFPLRLALHTVCCR